MINLSHVLPKRLLGLALVATTVIAVACGGGDDSGDDGGGAEPTGDSHSATTPVPVVGSPSSQIVATPAPAEVRVADLAGRPILTDAGGFTLYTFTDDVADAGTSACNGPCRSVWPPFAVEEGATITAPPEATGVFSTILRIDTSTQVTYNGKPLYRFREDAAPGEAKGDAFGDHWFVAQP